MELNEHCSCSHHDDRCICTEVLVSLNELREENLLCDAVLRLEDGGVFPVHRVILSICSRYFRKLFTTTLHTSEETDILLHGISSDVMTQILECVYLREVSIHCDNVWQLLAASEYLCIPYVTELCCDFLKNTMDLDNCIGILRFARLHSFADLENHSRRFVLRHFVKVSQQSEELLELPVEELQAIIESEELNVKNEEVVWECILWWINHDVDNRKGHIVGLLKGVRLGLLDAKFFKEEISKHPYVTENEACRPVILETNAFLHDSEMMTKEDKESMTRTIAKPRIPQDILFAIGGLREDRRTDFIETYDIRANRWSVMEQVDSIGPRGFHGTVVIGFDIYVIGGYDGEEVLSSCRCFNAVTKTWLEVAPMHKQRRNLSVAVLRGEVYAMGGCDGRLDHKTAEQYECKTNQWSWIAPMNSQRCNASAAVLNDKIYIAGASNGYDSLISVEVYDPDTNRWTYVAPMHFERAGHSCIVFRGSLYVLGGHNRTSCQLSTEKYDPAEDTWTEIRDMSVPGTNFNAEVIDDMLFFIGGCYDGVEIYNDVKNKWYMAADMNVYRFGMSTSVIMNLPNASDYAYKHMEKLMEENSEKVLDWENQ